MAATMGSLSGRPGSRARWRRDLHGVGVALGVHLLAGLVGCAHSETRPPREPAYETAAETRDPAPRAEAQVGYATWYGDALAGHHTANGERFDPTKMTAASRTLPFDTWVDVTSLDTGKSVRVRITDRGPFGHADRIIDLSREAARRLGTAKMGVFRVKLVIVPASATETQPP
jgi:rare lipoprotein A